MEERFLTVAEVAELLQLNQQTVRNWIDAGKLPAVHVGRRVRIKASVLDAFIERGASGEASISAEPESRRHVPKASQEAWQGVARSAEKLRGVAEAVEPEMPDALQALADAAEALAKVARKSSGPRH